RGKTVILCSHLLADVQDVCERVVVLYGGQIRAQGLLTDILREEDKTQIITPRLSDETIAELKNFFSAHGVKNLDNVAIDNPGRDLEDFFLEVVRKATEQNVSTAGAHAPGEMPEYLKGNNGVLTGQQILASLKGDAEAEKRKAEAAKAEAELRAAAAAKEAEKLKALEGLKGVDKPSEEEVKAAAKQAQSEADAKAREELNKKLAGLNFKK
ncbi:MAG: hypothetical protein MJ106_07980, partial [Lentisphaeria bacterium]|nr:hypothetical protein [Lentisphaeria bacterium]